MDEQRYWVERDPLGMMPFPWEDKNFWQNHLYREFYRDIKNNGLPLSPLESDLPDQPIRQEFALEGYKPSSDGPIDGPSGEWFVSSVRPETSRLDGLDQNTFGTWKIDPTILEDPEGFYSTILPELRLMVCKRRFFHVRDFFPDLMHTIPDCGMEALFQVRSILYLEGFNKTEPCDNLGYFKGEFDERLNRLYFKKNYVEPLGPGRIYGNHESSSILRYKANHKC
jgi:hypothetical protein